MNPWWLLFLQNRKPWQHIKGPDISRILQIVSNFEHQGSEPKYTKTTWRVSCIRNECCSVGFFHCTKSVKTWQHTTSGSGKELPEVFGSRFEYPNPSFCYNIILHFVRECCPPTVYLASWSLSQKPTNFIRKPHTQWPCTSPLVFVSVKR